MQTSYPLQTNIKKLSHLSLIVFDGDKVTEIFFEEIDGKLHALVPL
jgi:hypothetical protein